MSYYGPVGGGGGIYLSLHCHQQNEGTVIADSVYLVLNSLWDWEPVERSK